MSTFTKIGLAALLFACAGTGCAASKDSKIPKLPNVPRITDSVLANEDVCDDFAHLGQIVIEEDKAKTVCDSGDPKRKLVWHSNGVLALDQILYNNGNTQSLNQWNENGDHILEENYNPRSQNHGDFFVAFQNGKTKIKSSFRNGRLNGRYQEWFNNENHVKKYDGNFVNGTTVGLHVMKYSSGKTESKAIFDEKGKVHGLLQKWHDNEEHTLAYNGNFNHGVPIGTHTTVGNAISFECGKYLLSYEGMLKQILTYDNNGKPHGKQLIKDMDDNKVLEFTHVHGSKEGMQYQYFEGQIWKECRFVRNQLHGQCRTYNVNGSLTKVETFNRGTLVNSENLTLPTLE